MWTVTGKVWWTWRSTGDDYAGWEQRDARIVLAPRNPGTSRKGRGEKEKSVWETVAENVQIYWKTRTYTPRKLTELQQGKDITGKTLTAKGKEETLEAADSDRSPESSLRWDYAYISAEGSGQRVQSAQTTPACPRILHPATLSLQNEGDIKTCPAKQKLRAALQKL